MSTFGEYETKKRAGQQPPTGKQLERIREYIDHPAIQPHLDKLMGDMDKNLKTRGGTGALLGWMKEKIHDYDRRNPLMQPHGTQPRYDAGCRCVSCCNWT